MARKYKTMAASIAANIPMDAHTTVTTYDIYPDGSVKADAHIVKVCKKTGRIKGHTNISTQHGHL